MDDSPGLRRSSRRRTTISYKDVQGDSPAHESSPDTAPFIANPSEPEDEEVESLETPESEEMDVDDDDDDEVAPSRPRRAATQRPRAESTVSKISKDGKFALFAGDDDRVREQLEMRYKKWKNVLTSIPAELLEYTIGWGICSGDWKGKGGGRQKVEILESASPHIYKPEERTFKLTMGPKSKQKTVESRPMDTLQISPFFPKRRGHLINVGFPVWALDFLPQPPKSKTQYIVVSGHPTPDPRPSLYTPAPAPNTIQIWAVEPHTKKGEGKAYLAMTITHSWGSCWGLKFCPYGSCGDGRAGLLAGAFGDGIVRVMDVRQDWLGTAKQAVNVAVTTAGWEFSLGDGCLATCVCWKSHTEIVVGCSNGFVAIFDLSDDTETYDIPSFYSLVADTYIVSIASLAPSQPDLIGLASFDGQVTFFDIRSPESDIFPLLRQRSIPTAVTPLPFWKGILSPDEACGVRYSSLRLLRRGTMLFAHAAAIWDIAASQGGMGAGVHGLVLSVGSDGICTIVSSTDRILRAKGRKIVFRLEKEDDGTLKFTEEYGVDEPGLQKLANSKEFDPEVAVTKVVWSGNAGFESWYATGMRCGLIRIDDLNPHG